LPWNDQLNVGYRESPQLVASDRQASEQESESLMYVSSIDASDGARTIRTPVVAAVSDNDRMIRTEVAT
jgi:hypothetical protein